MQNQLLCGTASGTAVLPWQYRAQVRNNPAHLYRRARWRLVRVRARVRLMVRARVRARVRERVRVRTKSILRK